MGIRRRPHLVGGLTAMCFALGGVGGVCADAPVEAVGEPINPPVFEVPFADDIQIDGKDDDWRHVGIEQGQLTAANGQMEAGPDDLSAELFLAWSYEGLQVLVRVRDDAAVELAHNAELYLHDSVELFMVQGAEKVQYIIAPGIAEEAKGLRVKEYDHRRDAQLQRNNPLNLTAVSAKTEGGYLVEALVPWQVLAIDPVVDLELRVQVIVNDADQPENDRTIYTWHPRGDTHRNNDSTHLIRLAPSRHRLARLEAR